MSGKKYDDGKLRFDLVPIKPLQDIASVYTFGAKKYEDRNWELGLAYSRLYAATMRHLTSWWDGESNDQESGISHLAHAATDITMLLEFIHTHPELDDRPKSNGT